MLEFFNIHGYGNVNKNHYKITIGHQKIIINFGNDVEKLGPIDIAGRLWNDKTSLENSLSTP